RTISSVITSSRSQTRAMSRRLLLHRPVRALAALAALLVLAGCQADTAPAPKSERPVQIQRVSFQDVDRTREFVGVVRPRYETDLGFRVAGKIVTRVVNVGDRVAVGDVVARLDPEDLRLQLQSADAELAAATSNLAQAAADFERYAKLKTNGWASVADFDRKKAASDEAQGRLDRAQRALDLARNQLAYADLKADADGVITATLAEAGQVVAIGQPVARPAHSRARSEVQLVAVAAGWKSYRKDLAHRWRPAVHEIVVRSKQFALSMTLEQVLTSFGRPVYRLSTSKSPRASSFAKKKQ